MGQINFAHFCLRILIGQINLAYFYLRITKSNNEPNRHGPSFKHVLYWKSRTKLIILIFLLNFLSI